MNDIECPYCEVTFDLEPEDEAYYKEDGGVETQCPNCEKYFRVWTSISYYREGTKADCLNGAPHKFTNWRKLWEDAEKHPGEEYQQRRCEDCDKEELEWNKVEAK